MSRGKRYDPEAKLNIKKVFAVALAFAVLIMFIIGIKTLLTTTNEKKDTIGKSYYPVYTNEKWGVINNTGNIVINAVYDEMITIPNSKEDVFICMEYTSSEQDSYIVKVLNSKNEEILQGYDLVEAIENVDSSNNMWYEDEVLKVKKGETYGLVDFSGKEILKPEYEEITAMSGVKNSLIIKKDGKLGVSDNKGKIIIKPEFSDIKPIGDNYQNGYIVVDNSKYGVIDFTGQVILETKYNDIKPITGNKMYVVKLNGTWRITNQEGHELLENKFDEVTEIAEDRVVIVKNQKYGITLINGNEKIAPQYEELSYLFGNYYLAKNNVKYGVINTENEEVLPFEYNNITYIKDADCIRADMGEKEEIYNNKFEKKLEGIISEIDTKNAYLRVYADNDYKYYNFKFEEKPAHEVLNKNALFLSKKDGKYGYVDKNGKVKVDYIYDDAQEFNDKGFAGIKQDGKWGAINEQAEIIIEPTYDLNNNLMIDFIGKWHLGVDLNSYYYTDK